MRVRAPLFHSQSSSSSNLPIIQKDNPHSDANKHPTCHRSLGAFYTTAHGDA
jgi:hypothetical protein